VVGVELALAISPLDCERTRHVRPGGLGASRREARHVARRIAGPRAAWEWARDRAPVRAARRPRCEHAFVTSQGSAYSRFRRALATKNPHLVRAAAAELGQVQLEDALDVCLLFLTREPAAFAPAATRWHARFVLERRATPGDAELARAALHAMDSGDGATAARALAALCRTYRLPRAAEALAPWTS
jgi:hypothetical protein